MSKLTLIRGLPGSGKSTMARQIAAVEQIVELADVQVLRADDKHVTVRILGVDWFVKRPSTPTLRALCALGAGSHIYASRSVLIAVNAIVGRIRDHEKPSRYSAVMRDGSIVKISRREQAAFNRIYHKYLKDLVDRVKDLVERV